MRLRTSSRAAPASRRPPLFLDDLLDHQRAGAVDPAAAVRAHAVAAREDHADPPLPFGMADEELLGRGGGGGLDEEQEGEEGG